MYTVPGKGTLKRTYIAPENRPNLPQKEIHLNQPSIFTGRVSFREGISYDSYVCLFVKGPQKHGSLSLGGMFRACVFCWVCFAKVEGLSAESMWGPGGDGLQQVAKLPSKASHLRFEPKAKTVQFQSLIIGSPISSMIPLLWQVQ